MESYETVELYKHKRRQRIHEKRKDTLDSYNERRLRRIQERLDAEDEEKNSPKSSRKNHGNTRLPYGIAKGEDIDTTGMTPKEVWNALKGKGYSPEEEYEKLNGRGGKLTEKVTADKIPEDYASLEKEYRDIVRKFRDLGITPSQKEIDHNLEWIEGLYKNQLGLASSTAIYDYETEEEAEPRVTLDSPNASDELDKKISELNNKISENKKRLEKLNGIVRKPGESDKDKHSEKNSAKKEIISLMDENERLSKWNGRYENVKADLKEYLQSKKDYEDAKSNKSKSEKLLSRLDKIKEKYYKALKEKFPDVEDCNTNEELSDRIDAEQLFDGGSFTSKLSVSDNKKTLSPLIKMFDRYPKLKGKLKGLSIREMTADEGVLSGNAYGFSDTNGVVLNIKKYQSRASLQSSYKLGVSTGFHPDGTNEDAIILHEYGHQIDSLLSEPRKRFSNSVMDSVCKHFNVSEEEARKQVSGYAQDGARQYEDSFNRKNDEFFAEAWAEYLNSEHPREIATFVGHMVEDRLKEMFPNEKERTDSMEDKLSEIIKRYRMRRADRLSRRFDADDEEQSGGDKKTGGHGNTRLPYGLAKGEGIDTDNMTPTEVWDALAGKGYTPETAYKGLEEGKHGKELKDAEHQKNGGGIKGYFTKRKSLREEINSLFDDYKKLIDEDYKSLKRKSRELESAKRTVEWLKMTDDDYEKLKNELDSNSERYKELSKRDRWDITKEEKAFMDDYHVKEMNASEFETVRDYQDVPKQLEECEKKIEEHKNKINSKISELNGETEKAFDGSKALHKKVYTEEKRKSIIEDVKRTITDSGKFDAFDDSVKTMISDGVDKLSDVQLGIFRKTIGNVKFSVVEDGVNPHYSEDTREISIPKDCDAVTFFHEFGHYLDDYEGSGLKGDRKLSNVEKDQYSMGMGIGTDHFSDVLVSIGLESQDMADELKNALDEIAPGVYDIKYSESGVPRVSKNGESLWETADFYPIDKLVKNYVSEGDGLDELREKVGWKKEPQKIDFMELTYTPKRHKEKWIEKYKGAEKDYLSKRKEWEENKERIWAEFPDFYKEEEEILERRGKKANACGAVTDIINGLTLGQLISVYGAHQQSYWREDDRKTRKETVANINAMFMRGDQDAIEFMRRIFPKSMKKIESAYTEWMWENFENDAD